MGRADFSGRKNLEQLRFRAGDADRRVPDLDPLSERLKVVTTVASISSPHAALGLPSKASDGILRNLARPITSSRLGAISVRPRGITDGSQLFEPPFQVLVPRVREAVLDRVIETGQLGVCIGCLSAKPGDTFSVVLCLLCPSFQDAVQKLDDAIRRQQAVFNVFDNDRIQAIGGRQRELVASVQVSHGVSQRRSCLALDVDRSLVRYVSVKPDQASLRLRIHDLARTRMRYGYYRIYIMLRREGWLVNHKRVYRLYRQDGLSLRLKKPRRNVSAADRVRQPAAAAPNEMWSMDFVSDALFDGRCSPTIRMSAARQLG